MTGVGRRSPHFVIPPAKYFSSSPTYDKWVKLTIADVHALRTERGFEGQNLFFHLNHPIQYVYLVAPIVQFHEPTRLLTFLTIDDSSGACIDLKIRRNDPAKCAPDEVFNTAVANLTIESRLGHYDVLKIDGKIADVNTVIKAKCTISTYKGVRQLDLKRASIIKDTNEEVAAWRATAAFKRDVLSKPWVLTSAERAEIDERNVQEEKARRDEEQRYRRQARRNEERKKRHAIELSAHEQRVEIRRRKAEMKYDAGALPGSDRLAAPWD